MSRIKKLIPEFLGGTKKRQTSPALRQQQEGEEEGEIEEESKQIQQASRPAIFGDYAAPVLDRRTLARQRKIFKAGFPAITDTLDQTVFGLKASFPKPQYAKLVDIQRNDQLDAAIGIAAQNILVRNPDLKGRERLTKLVQGNFATKATKSQTEVLQDRLSDALPFSQVFPTIAEIIDPRRYLDGMPATLSGKILDLDGRYAGKGFVKTYRQAYKATPTIENYRQLNRAVVFKTWNAYVQAVNTFNKGQVLTSAQLKTRQDRAKERADSGVNQLNGMLNALRRNPALGAATSIEDFRRQQRAAMVQNIDANMITKITQRFDATTQKLINLR